MGQQRSRQELPQHDPARPEPGSPPSRPAWWLRALSRLPLPLLYALAAAAAFLLHYVVRYRVGVARENLRRCFPAASATQVEALLARSYRHLAQVSVEFLKVATISGDELRRHVRCINLPLVHAETAAGRSILLLAAHQCNWEWALQAVALELGVPLDAAYKPLHNAAVDGELLKVRRRFGARMVAAKKLVREIARRRDEVRAICLMADQAPVSSPGRHWLTFMGRDTAFYPGPAEIARMTGYAAFFVAMRRTGRGRYDLEFIPVTQAGERFEPQAFTARYAGLIEAQILAQPADWTWTHRRWKHARPLAVAPLA